MRVKFLKNVSVYVSGNIYILDLPLANLYIKLGFAKLDDSKPKKVNKKK